MGNVLVRFNQASYDAQSWTNLKARHLGWSQESKGFWFKREDGSEFGDPVFVPSIIGQGMGRRYTQAAHGFVTKQLVRWTGTSWVLALATADASTLATHMVVCVVDATQFDLARVGAWTLGGAPNGSLYLSGSLAGAATTVKPASPLLTQRVAVGDGLAYHLTFDSTPEVRLADASDYLPLAGGSMAQNAQIQFPGQQNVGGFYGMYWQASDCWSRISHWGGIWAPSLKSGERRGGLSFAPDSYGASIVLRSPEGQPGVSIYTHETGGYSLYSWMPNGDARVALGVNPSGYGEAYFEDSSSKTTIKLTGNDGAIRAKSIFTGTGQWTQVERITPEGVASFGSVRTGPDQYTMVERINGLGDGYLTSLSVSGLSDGYIPIVSTAGGLLGNSSLSEDATSVKCEKPMTLNGATRPAWGAAFSGALQITKEVAIAPYNAVGPQAFQVWANVFYDGAYKAASSYADQGYPAIFTAFNGSLEFSASQANPVAGGIISDLLLRFSVNRFGDASLARGLGVHGVTPPTSRPTVNAAATDLATTTALLNQIRTHLIACGLVQ